MEPGRDRPAPRRARGGHAVAAPRPTADWLSADTALAAIIAAVSPLEAERRPLLDCIGRALAQPVVSPVDLPPWDNSSMDGFAVRAADIAGVSAAAPRTLRVVDDVAAGSFPRVALAPGEAARVMTGAPVPQGADSVVRVEHTDGGSDLSGAAARVQIRADTDARRNIRRRGEDVHAGAEVLPAGAVLGAAQIALAASVGCAAPAVVRRPRIAVLCSGDELVEIEAFGEVRAGRRIVSSNGYGLAARLAELGMEARLLGIARDDPAEIAACLRRAAGCDALLTSAGVSVGEHDHMLSVLHGMGLDLRFWRVRVRPGSALAFGTVGALGGIPWLGLPGNPVSTLVCFELFARPMLLRMAGHRALYPPTVSARFAGNDYAAPADLALFLRVRLKRAGDEWTATLAGTQSSGAGSVLAAADALLAVPAGRGSVRRGDVLRAVILSGAPAWASAEWWAEPRGKGDDRAGGPASPVSRPA